jgi:sulfur carrier protein
VSVIVNGAVDEAAAGRTLSELLHARAGGLRGSAVVVDDEVIPRAEWDTYRLRAGQRVELITAVQGG